MNDAAEVMLARPDSPLLLKSGVVAASSLEDTRNLQRLVLDACSLEDKAMPGVGGTLVLPSGHEGFEAPRLSLSVAPYFNAHAFGLASGRCAVVMIRELPNRGSSSSAEHVRQVFGLTNAEAKLAASLATGQSLREAAAAQRIQFGTARYYLAQIFRKTNTHRQSELVDLLRIAQPLWRLG
jgi:DNA-binding CsgD family transcriptional regulator